MEFEDIRIIHHIGDEITQLQGMVNKDIATETYSWRLTYKGKKHGRVLVGTYHNPITDKDIVMLMEHMARYMKRLRRGEREKCVRKI